MQTRHLFLRRATNSTIAAALMLLNESCYQASHELALYDGAVRLGDGSHFEYQESSTDCGIAAAVMMLRLSGRQAEYDSLRRQVRLSAGYGLSLAQIRDLMLDNKVATRGLMVDPSRLDDVAFPLVAWLPTHHVVVVESVTPDFAVISDPGRGRWKVSRAKLSSAWDGTALVPVRAPPGAAFAIRRSDTTSQLLTRGSNR